MVDDATSEKMTGSGESVVTEKPFVSSSGTTEHKGLIPPDLGINPQAVAQVEQVVKSWEPGREETDFAREMLQNTLDQVDGLIPGDLIKKMKSSRNVKEIRDALVSGESDVENKVWNVTTRGRIEAVRKALQNTSLRSRFTSWFRSSSADAKTARDAIKGSEEETDQLDWKEIQAGCVLADLQSGNRPYVRKGAVASMTAVGKKMEKERLPEQYEKSLQLVSVAIEPIKNDLLLHANKAIGPVIMR